MSEHIVPTKIYIAVFFALMCLTLITWQAALHDINIAGVTLNPAIALGIAGTKATLVILFFMGAKYSPRLTKVVIGAGLFWLMILLSLTMIDYVSRPLLTTPGPTAPYSAR
jgi:cytochrome c oxidase subunit IV